MTLNCRNQTVQSTFLLLDYGDVIVKLLPASALKPFDAVCRSALRFVKALGLSIAYGSRRLGGSHQQQDGSSTAFYSFTKHILANILGVSVVVGQCHAALCHKTILFALKLRNRLLNFMSLTSGTTRRKLIKPDRLIPLPSASEQNELHVFSLSHVMPCVSVWSIYFYMSLLYCYIGFPHFFIVAVGYSSFLSLLYVMQARSPCKRDLALDGLLCLLEVTSNNNNNKIFTP